MEPQPPLTNPHPAFGRGGEEAGEGVTRKPCACAEGGGEGHLAGRSGDSFRKGENGGSGGP